jgi:hypothetical protein
MNMVFGDEYSAVGRGQTYQVAYLRARRKSLEIYFMGCIHILL